MKINITERAVVFTSDLTIDEIKKVAKYRPKFLNLIDPETKDLVCAIGIATKGNGSISEFGVSFAPISVNAEGKAAVTIVEEGAADVKQTVIDKYAATVVNVNKIEKAVKEALDSIKADEEEVLGCIG